MKIKQREKNYCLYCDLGPELGDHTGSTSADRPDGIGISNTGAATKGTEASGDVLKTRNLVGFAEGINFPAYLLLEGSFVDPSRREVTARDLSPEVPLGLRNEVLEGGVGIAVHDGAAKMGGAVPCSLDEMPADLFFVVRRIDSAVVLLAVIAEDFRKPLLTGSHFELTGLHVLCFVADLDDIGGQ